jgi:hypothetical protein
VLHSGCASLVRIVRQVLIPLGTFLLGLLAPTEHLHIERGQIYSKYGHDPVFSGWIKAMMNGQNPMTKKLICNLDRPMPT